MSRVGRKEKRESEISGGNKREKRGRKVLFSPIDIASTEVALKLANKEKKNSSGKKGENSEGEKKGVGRYQACNIKFSPKEASDRSEGGDSRQIDAKV